MDIKLPGWSWASLPVSSRSFLQNTGSLIRNALVQAKGSYPPILDLVSTEYLMHAIALESEGKLMIILGDCSAYKTSRGSTPETARPSLYPPVRLSSLLALEAQGA